jgi:hypothetical protein
MLRISDFHPILNVRLAWKSMLGMVRS